MTADPSNTAIPMLRHTFEVKKAVRRVRLYMTARGIYEVQVNGRNLTENLLAPGLTQYDRRLNYQMYDLTDFVQNGKNGIGVVLSSGWWSDAQTYTVKNYNYFGDNEALLCKIVMEYESGEREVVISEPETWQYFGEGPYRYAGLFQGEEYDAEKEWVYRRFSCADFDASDWEKTVLYQPVRIAAYNTGFGRDWPEVNQREPLLLGGYEAPVRIAATRTAQTCIRQSVHTVIYDFGQEMAGVPEIVFYEKAGTRICIRYAEMLYPDLPCYAGNVGKLFTENYRAAQSTDIYICRGAEEGEVYLLRCMVSAIWN